MAVLCASRSRSQAGASDVDKASADLLFAQAETHLGKGTAADVRAARELYQSAAEAYRRLGDAGREARARSGEGECGLHLGEAREARESFGCALEAARASGDSALEAEIHDGMGEASFLLGDSRGALASLARAEAIWRSRSDHEHLAATWNSVALAYDELGEQRIALGYLEEALLLARSAGNALYEGAIVASMGKLAEDLGEWQRALDLYGQGLAAARAGKDARGEAVMMNNIGLAHFDLGDLDDATRYLEEALVLRRRVGDRRGEARTLTALGRVAFERRNLDEAAGRYRAALELSRAAGDPTGESTALSRQGELLAFRGRKAEARDEYRKALAIRQRRGATREAASSLTRIAALDADLGEREEALAMFETALVLNRSVGDLKGQVDVWLERARVERDMGRLEEAAEDVSRGISAIETLRTNVASPVLRATYLAKVQSAYVLDIDVKMRRHRLEPLRGFDARAVEAAESMRARSLLDLLSQSGSRIEEGGHARDLERIRDLQVLANAKLERQIRLGTGPHAEAERAAVGRELSGLVRELEELEARIRVSNPRYADLADARPLGLADVRRLVLDEDTLLLSFVLGEERGFLFTVGTSSLHCRELPPRAEIETVARRLLAAVKARQDAPKAELSAARVERRRRAEAEFDAAAGELSRMLLGPSIEPLGRHRLAIVPDGILQFVPFPALPGASGSSPPRPLIWDHEIVTLPSASTLVFMRRDRDGRARAAKSVVVLADPVFEADDERIPARGNDGRPRPSPPPADLLRSATEAGFADGRLPRLPFTRREAEAIVRLARRDSREALDFDASRETATDSSLSDYRYVHFATHGFLNAAHPELSGIVLSLVDRAGRERPGFLSAVEVHRLKLNADLVVLSGCQTALGREIGGEGLLGLTRAFVYAGTPRVLATLWRVDDAATAQLMGALYEELLGPSKRSPAAALRSAQLSLLRGPRWRSPVDWAAFVLLGDWR